MDGSWYRLDSLYAEFVVVSGEGHYNELGKDRTEGSQDRLDSLDSQFVVV
jgi:hypothetical protein